MLYLLPALLGASPLMVGALAAVPRLVAAIGIRWLGRLAQRRRGLVIACGATCGCAGFILLALAGPAFGWTVAGFGACLAETGFNPVGDTLKGSLSRAGAQQQLLSTAFRFASNSVAGFVLSVLWWYLERRVSTAEASVVVALLAAVVMFPLATRVSRDRLRPAGHALKGKGKGRIDLVVLPSLPTAAKLWICARIGDRWIVCGLRRPEYLLARASGSVLRVEVLRRRRPIAGPPTSSASVPPQTLWDGGLLIGDGRARVARLVRLASEVMEVRSHSCPWRDLPPALTECLEGDDGHLQPHLRGEVDVEGSAGVHRLESDAFARNVRLLPYVVDMPVR
jgi:hypothetical protein